MSSPGRLNFHHLHYFWAVAREGNLTRAAKQLRIAPSALSAQIRQLEDQLGEPLFVRQGRTMAISEAGRIALDYAESIFAAGDELVSTLKDGRSREQVLRVGTVATLSRNFQESFLGPLLGAPDVRLRLRSGSLDDLVTRLVAHDLDLVLSNRAVQPDEGRAVRTRRIARQGVSLIGHGVRHGFRFPENLEDVAMIVPGPESEIRAAFDAMLEQAGIRARIVAEVDDMATMRLLARDTDYVTLLPSVVVRDELRSGVLHELCVVPGLFESFYAITVERHFPHPWLRTLLARDEAAILAMNR
ncbi:MAG: LysR family transcriptional regulator [Polyangiales bacterium]